MAEGPQLATGTSVLFVNHTANLGGGELALADFVRRTRTASALILDEGPLVEELRAAGANVTVESAGRVLKVRRNTSLLKALGAIPQLAYLIWRVASVGRSHDVLYANSQKAFIISAIAAKIIRRPLIWHLRDIISPDHFGLAMRKISIGLANVAASHVIVNSEATRESFLSAGGVVPTTVAFSGIDSHAFDSCDRELARATLREEIRSGDAPVIGIFSRLAPWKGQHIAIEALRSLPHHHLVIVGSALFGEEDYSEKLHGMVKDYALNDRVHFLPFRRDVHALMCATDIIVHSSVAPEPFGRVIVEGMMARCPVIATAAGGALEIIVHGESGLHVNPGNIAAMADAIKMLADQPELAKGLATNGYLRANALFGIEATVQVVQSVISAVASGSK